MRCKGCKAWINNSCIIKKEPYVSKVDLYGPGCSFNRITVLKKMRDLGLLEKEYKDGT